MPLCPRYMHSHVEPNHLPLLLLPQGDPFQELRHPSAVDPRTSTVSWPGSRVGWGFGVWGLMCSCCMYIMYITHWLYHTWYDIETIERGFIWDMYPRSFSWSTISTFGIWVESSSTTAPEIQCKILLIVVGVCTLGIFEQTFCGYLWTNIGQIEWWRTNSNKAHARAQTTNCSFNCVRLSGRLRSMDFRIPHWLLTIWRAKRQLSGVFFKRCCHWLALEERALLWLKFGNSFLLCKDSSLNGQPEMAGILGSNFGTFTITWLKYVIMIIQ